MLLLDCISEICQCLWCVCSPIFMAPLEKGKTFMWVIWKTVTNLFGKAVSWREVSRLQQRQTCVIRHHQHWGSSNPCAAGRMDGCGAFQFAGFSQGDLWDRVLTGTKQRAMKIFLHCFQRCESTESRVVVLGGVFWQFMCCWVLPHLGCVFTELLG